MIGKAEWFQRRKYGGWGVTPKTWQGFAYLAAILLPLGVFQTLPFWSIQTRTYVTIGWAALVALDLFHIMATLKRDEREYKIEAMSERNAAWAMIFVIAIGVFYESSTSTIPKEFSVDIFLIAALVGGLLAKMLSNIVYERRAL